MKKIFLLALSFAAYTGFAQTVLWDGDVAVNGLWGDGSPEIVENPEKDGINTSDKCIRFTMTNDSKIIKIKFADNVQTKMNGSTRVSLMIRKPQNQNLQIELSDPWDGSAGYWEKVAAWYGGGGKWQKVVFDFATNNAFDCPGVIAITAQTANVDGSQDVYIDNIVIEPATLVDGKALSGIEDGSLSGDIKLSGAWMKGDCQNANGDWVKYEYDDFAALKTKLSPSVTSIDMAGAVLKDAYNAFLDINPNAIVYAGEYVDGDNVVVNGSAGNVVIKQDGTFGVPEGFTAENITVEMPLVEGYNAVVLPFDVTADELGAEELSTFAGISGDGSDKTVLFTAAETVAANTPMLVKGAAAKESLVFTGKEIKATTAAPVSGEFKGFYAPQSAAGLWLVGGDGTFSKAADDARVKAFGACWDVPEATSLQFSTGTGIGEVEVGGSQTVDVYTIGGVKVRTASAANAFDGLPGGVYIVNKKKYVVR